MADYRGIIKFIGENNDYALVQESSVYESDVATSTGIGTGDGSTRDFSGTLQYVVESSNILVKVNSVTTSTGIAGGVVSGSAISSSTGVMTSTGATNTLNYSTGVLSLLFTSAATPANGHAVTVNYEYGAVSAHPKGLKLIKGDFANFSVDDAISYAYDAISNLTDGYSISESY